MERICGFSAGEVRRLAVWLRKAFQNPDKRAEAEAYFHAAANPAARDAELLTTIVRADGERRSVRFYASPIVLPNEQAAGAVAVVLDVTREQAVEQQLIRSERLAAVGELATILAHEIKNPLAGISGAIQVIGHDMAPDDSRKEIIGEILHQVARLDNTIKDLLVFARPNPPQLRPASLAETVERTLAILGREPAMRHIVVQKDLPDDLPAIEADVDQLEQVCMNVVLNAIQAVQAGGRLTIVARCNGHDTVTLGIRDTGAGMTPEQQARAFEPFYTTKVRGTGLGLPICRKIVEAHNGRISLRSRPGRGTEVEITLPIKSERAAWAPAPGHFRAAAI